MKPTVYQIDLPSRKLVYQLDVSHGGQFEVALYRWEFLRRNPRYCADYNRFMDRFGAWLLKRKARWPYDEDDRANWTKPEKKYYRARVEPVLNRLRRKWQISDLFPPKPTPEEWEADKRSNRIAFPPSRPSDVRATGELKRMGFRGTGFASTQHENLLLIQVDLNLPMKDLLDHTRLVLGFAQRSYRAEMEARGYKVAKSRRRLEDYVLHLRIWDLKKEGKGNTEIARLVFPNLPGQSTLSKVRDHLRAANKLISGHYREIR
jgi:hypothetical protein